MNSSSTSPDAGEQTIYDAARQMRDAHERAAYLDSACDGNELLRERIEKLLKAGERADEFLAQNPLGPLPPALSPSGGERETGRGV